MPLTEKGEREKWNRRIRAIADIDKMPRKYREASNRSNMIERNVIDIIGNKGCRIE
jgi:hypothetical protein